MRGHCILVHCSGTKDYSDFSALRNPASLASRGAKVRRTFAKTPPHPWSSPSPLLRLGPVAALLSKFAPGEFVEPIGFSFHSLNQ